jgi:hypothetical protein
MSGSTRGKVGLVSFVWDHGEYYRRQQLHRRIYSRNYTGNFGGLVCSVRHLILRKGCTPVGHLLLFSAST